METSTCAIFSTRGVGALEEELALSRRLAPNLGAMEQAQGGSTEEGMLANESTWRPRRGRMHSHTSMKAVPRPRQATCRPPVCKISRACYEAVSPSSCVLFKRVQNVKEHQVETGSEAARAGKGRQHVYASALRRRTLKDSEHIGSAARHSVLSASGAAWFATQVTATAAAAQKTSPVCSGRSKRQKWHEKIAKPLIQFQSRLRCLYMERTRIAGRLTAAAVAAQTASPAYVLAPRHRRFERHK